jgi:hypothetical protein
VTQSEPNWVVVTSEYTGNGNPGKWVVGDIFTPSKNRGEILKITNIQEFSTYGTSDLSSWCVIPNAPVFNFDGIEIDRYGSFDYKVFQNF